MTKRTVDSVKSRADIMKHLANNLKSIKNGPLLDIQWQVSITDVCAKRKTRNVPAVTAVNPPQRQIWARLGFHPLK